MQIGPCAKDLRQDCSGGIIAIAIDSGTLADVRAKAKELQIRYPLLFGTEKTMSDFGINAFPPTIILTKDWKVHHAYLSPVPNKRELIEQEIDTLRSEPVLRP